MVRKVVHCEVAGLDLNSAILTRNDLIYIVH